ncbi:unnamed protein product [Porites evermanni]|uniref:Uncharacterized protein n=1 Tax=Porites evermanni TaxID=104178 RepID=A0ABN8RPK6_9CNID|nr:unnamed protein product [Porites evermanni]
MRLMSCQLTSSIAFLDAAGNWTKFNIPPGVLEVTNDTPLTTSHIKIIQQSESLTSKSGHIIKLGLNCTGPILGQRLKCLMFKAEGVLKFPLCNYTVPTPPPSDNCTTNTTTTCTPPHTTRVTYCCDYWGNPCRSFIPGFH